MNGIFFWLFVDSHTIRAETFSHECVRNSSCDKFSQRTASAPPQKALRTLLGFAWSELLIHKTQQWRHRESKQHSTRAVKRGRAWKTRLNISTKLKFLSNEENDTGSRAAPASGGLTCGSRNVVECQCTPSRYELSQKLYDVRFFFLSEIDFQQQQFQNWLLLDLMQKPICLFTHTWVLTLFQCCNLSGGVALIVRFTTNGMCVKNNTINTCGANKQ